MTLNIMLQGTASDVGKSLLVAGLCRVLTQMGYRCAPFKAQNMALNSGITRCGDEMGRAQIFQAEAAGVEPDVRMNPVLLKPTSDRRSQVIVMGQVLGDMDAMRYHEYKTTLKGQIREAYDSLAAEYDIIVLEGAGSPAEINLRDRDIVNMGMAEMVDAPVILVADIDRGGVFASIYGTIALLRPEEKARVKGVLINKFRGDVSLLTPGIREIEELTQVPVLGVIPYLDVDMEEEDGVALQPERLHQQLGLDLDQSLDIAVIRLPHISNFTDFNALAAQPDVNLRYVHKASQLGKPDFIVLPGSKNTLGDLNFLFESGFSSHIRQSNQQGTPVFGICGGYQMLGKMVFDGVESGIDQMNGLGLLDCVTRFAPEKRTIQVTGSVSAHVHGVVERCAECTVEGYEIHMGVTELGCHAQPFLTIDDDVDGSSYQDGAVSDDGSVVGCYLHGLFDRPVFSRRLLNALRARKGLPALADDVFDYRQYKDDQFNQLALELNDAIDMDRIIQLIQKPS